jgi:hypothetical protein
MAETLIFLNKNLPYDTPERKRRRAYIVSCLHRNYSMRRDGVPDIPFAERKRLADLAFGANKRFKLDDQANTLVYTRIIADYHKDSPNLYLGDWNDIWTFHQKKNYEAPYTGTVDDTAVFTPQQIRDVSLFLHEDKRRKYDSSDTATAVREQEQEQRFLDQITPGLFDAAYNAPAAQPAAHHSSTYGSSAYGSRHLPPPAGLTDYSGAPSWGRSSSGSGGAQWGRSSSGGAPGGTSRQHSGSSHDLNLASHHSLQDYYDDTSLHFDPA